jgi:hypothetical protein
MPGYGIFGWQKPCYLLQDGYADSFQKLLDSTDWSKYGYESGNPKCSSCMLHSGYEASAVDYTFSFRGIFATMRAMLFSGYRDGEAARQLAAEKPKSGLVQIDAIAPRPTIAGTEIAAPAQVAAGIEQAFDYRGDVTVTLGTGEKLEGYIFDREQKADLAASTLRIMTKPGQKLTIRYADVSQLSFTGRDMADGRSWEAWVRKYAERKAAAPALLPAFLVSAARNQYHYRYHSLTVALGIGGLRFRAARQQAVSISTKDGEVSGKSRPSRRSACATSSPVGFQVSVPNRSFVLQGPDSAGYATGPGAPTEMPGEIPRIG